MEGRVKRYDQFCWDDPNQERERRREYENLWGRFDIDYDELRSGLKSGDDVARDIIRRYAGHVSAMTWVVQNAVIRELTVTEMLRQVIDFEASATPIETRSTDIPYPYKRWW